MTGGIEEYDLTTVSRGLFILDSYFVRADMLGNAAGFAFRHTGEADRVQKGGLAVIHVAHNRDHRWPRCHLDSGFFSAGSSVDILRCLFLKRDHIRFRPEEAGNFAGQFRVERLIDGGKNAAREQTRDEILSPDFQLLSEILNADSFCDRDVARDGQRLIRHHHTRRWNVALHRAFLHTAWDIPLTRPARWTARSAAGTRRSRQARANSQRTWSGRRLPRRMHGTALARTQRRARRTGHLRTKTLENRLTRHRSSGRGTHRGTGSSGAGLRGGLNRFGRSLVHGSRSRLRNDHPRRGRS